MLTKGLPALLALSPGMGHTEPYSHASSPRTKSLGSCIGSAGEVPLLWIL